MRKRLLLLGILFASLTCAGLAQEHFVRLVTRNDGTLNIEHGSLQFGPVEPGWWSAMWERSLIDQGTCLLRNRYTGQYLVLGAAGGTEGLGVTSEPPSPQGRGPHYWRYGELSSEGSVLLSTATQPMPVDSVAAPQDRQSYIYIQDVVFEEPAQPEAPVAYSRLLKDKDALNVEQGPPVFSQAGPGFFSAMWEVRQVDPGRPGYYVILTNRWTSQVLSSAGATLMTEAASPLATGNEAFVWRAERTGKNLEYLTLTNSQGARIDNVRLQPVP